MIDRFRRRWRGIAITLCLAVTMTGAITVMAKPAPAHALGVSSQLPREARSAVSAPFFDQVGKDFILADTKDDRLFYTVGGVVAGQQSYSTAGWLEVPGGMTTPWRPAVLQVTDGGGLSTIMLAAVSGNGHLYLNHLRKNGTFVGWFEPPYTGAAPPFFTEAPAIVTNGSATKPYTELFVVAPTTNFGLHYQRINSNTEEGWAPGWTRWGLDQLVGGVSAAYFDGKFQVFTSKLVIGEPMKLYHADLVVGSNPVWEEVPGQLGSSDEGFGELLSSVTAAGDTVLTLAAKGVTPAVGDLVQTINLVKTAAGTTWGPWKNYATASTPRAPIGVSVSTSNVGTVHQYVIGRDGSVGVMALVPTAAGTSMTPAEGYQAKYVMVPHSDTPASQGRPDPVGTDWTTTIGTGNYLNPDPWADDATEGTDGLAVTKLGLTSDNLTVARKISDGHLWVTIGTESRGYQPFGWAAIPGALPDGAEAKTAFAPAATTLGNDVYVAMVAADQKMYYQVFNAKTKVWNAAWTQVGPGLFSQGPALAVWHGALQAFGPGLDKKVYWLQGHQHTNFPVAFTMVLSSGPGALKTDKPVAAVEFGNDLVVVARRWSDGSDGQVDGQVASWTIGSFRTDSQWATVPGGMITVAAPAVTTNGPNQAVLHVVVRDAQLRIRYQSRVSAPGAYPGTWRPEWTEVPGGGVTKNAPAVTRNGAAVSIVVTAGGPRNDAWENTLGTNPADGAFITAPPLGNWKLVPSSDLRPIPLNSGGEPIPDPDNPGPPPAELVVHWYVYCLSGPGVQDGYVPALEENQPSGLAQATEFATKNYGPPGGQWQLTLVANPTQNGCQEAQTQYKWCVQKYEWPGEAYWETYTITNNAANFAAGLANAKSQVQAARGPEYNNGHQSWGVSAYDQEQCI